MHYLEHKIKILLHLMICHEDWNQYKHVLPSVKEAKRKVQEVLKPGGGGLNSTNIGRINKFYLLASDFQSFCIILSILGFYNINIAVKIY